MIELTVDGSYNNNIERPSRLGVGITIDNGVFVKKIAIAWTANSTSMKAEYEALIHGLVLIIGTYTDRELKIRMDAQVAVRQVKGEYNVGSPSILPYYNRVMRLLTKFNYTISHIPRTQNTECDKLSKCN